MNRCQVQYLDPIRRNWVDCAKRTRTAVAVGDDYRDVCSDHRDEVRRVERAGLAGGLRWSEQPTPPKRPPLGDPNQRQLLDAKQQPRRWAL